MAKASIRKEIIALEKSYWDALKVKNGARAAQLSGAKALVTGARGVASIGKTEMTRMTEASDWSMDSYEFEDVEVIAPAANVAIIAYTARRHVTMEGKKSELHTANSSTWVKSANGWVCHAHSDAFIIDPNPT